MIWQLRKTFCYNSYKGVPYFHGCVSLIEFRAKGHTIYFQNKSIYCSHMFHTIVAYIREIHNVIRQSN